MYENLVFEGGAVLGCGFALVPKALEEYGVLQRIKRVAGSSAGSIAATLIALKYSPDDINRIVTEIKFTDFKDSWIWAPYNFARGAGVHSGKHFENWISDKIMVATGKKNITFAELFERTGIELVITGTNLSAEKTEYFSYVTTPSMQVSEAIRISISIPFYFTAVKMNGDVYIDGGVLTNYPIAVFDGDYYGEPNAPVNMKTLGFVLHGKKGRNDGFLPSALLGMLLNYVYASNSEKRIGRTVLIDVGDISSMNFGISTEEVLGLGLSGYESTSNYLRKKKEFFGI